MAYQKTVWVNGQAPAINADNLNKIEQGIADAAPGGYGLGDVWNVAPSRDADLITGSGFQMAVLNTPTGNNWWGILSFVYDADSATQWAIPQNTAAYYGSVCKREKRAGTWTPWEWVNPPLVLGVEYRTTERYLAKPVYVRVVDCGYLPNATKKQITVGTDTNIRILEIHGVGNSDNGIFPTCNFGGNLAQTWSSDGIVSCWCMNNVIHISTGGNRSTISTKAIIKYYKLTD